MLNIVKSTKRVDKQLNISVISNIQLPCILMPHDERKKSTNHPHGLVKIKLGGSSKYQESENKTVVSQMMDNKSSFHH